MPNEAGQTATSAAEYLTVEETADLLHTPRSTLDQWRHYQVGPPYVKLRRRVLYRRRDLMDWMERRTVRPEQR